MEISFSQALGFAAGGGFDSPSENRYNNEAQTAPEQQVDINTLRGQIIKELERQGTILPQYNWQDRTLVNTLEAITADWFARHPETKRGSGEFQRRYPEKVAGKDQLWAMAQKGRITPDEYIALYRGMYNF